MTSPKPRDIVKGSGADAQLHNEPDQVQRPLPSGQRPLLSFQPGRTAPADNPAVAQFIDELLAIDAKTRKRRRKARDIETFALAVRAVVGNFWRPEIVADSALTVMVGPRFQNAKGKPRCYGQSFIDLLGNVSKRGGLLYRLGYAEVLTVGYHLAPGLRRTTTIAPTQKFFRRMPPPPTTPGRPEGDYRDAIAPTIIVKRADGSRASPASLAPKAAEQLQTAMREINAKALGGFTLDQHADEILVSKDNYIIDSEYDVVLHRVFHLDDTGTLIAGRLWGGWWQTLRRHQRDRIKGADDGSPTCCVDMTACFLHCAYYTAGLKPPEGDLYQLDPADEAEGEKRRDGAKVIVSCMIQSKSPLRSWPGRSHADRAALRECFPPGQKLSDLVTAIKTRHAAIADQFFIGRALFFQRIESDICVSTLLRLIGLGLTALPLHDGFIVKVSDAETVAQVLADEANKRIGPIPVAIKPHFVPEAAKSSRRGGHSL